jgi:hypothetical protein
MYKSKLIGISICSLLSATPMTAAFAADSAPGMYHLTASFADGGTCTPSQRIAFSYFAYTDSGLGSELYYLSPGTLNSDVVATPKQNRHSLSKWNGKITWAVNPWTFVPPPIDTAFHIKFTFIESRLFNFNGMFEVPLADGSTCTEFVSYRAIRTGSIF